MSNKIVPNIYRTVIDDVIASIKPDFDEYGISEDVLAELQHKWENKVMASHVAEFENAHVPAPVAPPPQQHPQITHPQYPPHPSLPMQMMTPFSSMHGNHFPPPPGPTLPGPTLPGPTLPGPTLPGPTLPHVKTEPLDSRFALNAPYSLPPLPGPQLNGARSAPPGGPLLPFPRPTMTNTPPRMYNGKPVLPGPHASLAHQNKRIPQVDGPSSSASESSSPPPDQQRFAPRPKSEGAPKLEPEASSASLLDEEAINSDLDDSATDDDEEAEEGAAGETDIVFCTYDKVARVKNKWKCILKDGMIHINGRDYLFAKCTGEFEW